MKDEPTRAPVDGPALRRMICRRLAVACCAVFLALPASRPLDAAARRHLAVCCRRRAANYDCHANFSFVLMHVVAPHYSTLLKFDTANYPQVVGDLADSWSVSLTGAPTPSNCAQMCCFTTARN